MATAAATQAMKRTPAKGYWPIAYNHFKEGRNHRGEGIGEATRMIATLQLHGEHELSNERFSYQVQAQVETCNVEWVRVLVFENGEMVLTRRVIVQQGNMKDAIERAREIASIYFEKRESQLIEVAQPLFAVAG